MAQQGDSGGSGGRGDGGGFTRRGFLEMVGRVGGAAAVYESMVMMGLVRTPTAWAGPPQLAADYGRGQRVVVLGAGVGGLTAALRLLRAGYEVDVYEARDRPGGRSFTVRRGDVIQEMGNPAQVCQFDEGQFLNAGPGRLPYHHQAILDLCRDLGVELEIYVMSTTANVYQTPDAFAGEPRARRRVANDTRGYISELLAKATLCGCLDDDLSAAERRDLLDLLRSFGMLQSDFSYTGSTRSGYVVPPGVHHSGIPEPPLELAELLRARFWDHRFYQPEDYLWQPTLFHPVGGMDKIVQALAAAVGSERIHPEQEVVSIWNEPQRVRVRLRDRKTGVERDVEAEHCISNIPLPILAKIDSHGTFSEGFRRAVEAVPFEATCKVGWQAKRFWENRPLQIYGGISWIDHPIVQMWYPSHRYFDEVGVLTGAYNYGAVAETFGRLSLAERLALAFEGGQRLHPKEFTRATVDVDKGLSIAWQNMEFERGGWADWTGLAPETYERLLNPDGRFWVCGDQVSHLPGWQEGAVLSADHVVGRLSGIEAAPVEVLSVPDTRSVTRGHAG